MKNIYYLCFLTISSILFWSNLNTLQAQELEECLEMSLEQLMLLDVETVSKSSEELTDAPGVITTISSQEIEMFGANNLLEVLERVTSVYMAGSYLFPQNVASIRGDLLTHYDNHTLVLIDGRPFRETVYGGINSSVYLCFPLAMIKRIEIIRGPGSVLYGTNAVSGVINIITKNASENTNSVQIGGGSLWTATQSISAGFQHGNLEVNSAISFSNEKGWELSAIDELGKDTTFHFGENNTGAVFNIKYKNLRINTGLFQSSQDNFGALPFWDKKRMEQNRVFGDIGYSLKLKENWTCDFNLTGNYYSSEFKIIDQDWRTNSMDFILEACSHLDITDNIKWLIGGNIYAMTGEATQQFVAHKTIPEYDELWWSAYSQLDVRLLKWVKLIGGVQINQAEGLNLDVVPRAGIILQPFEKFGIKALYSQAYRAAFEAENSINSTGVLIGNSDLDPEKVSATDIQIFYYSDKIQVGLTAFQSKQENLITRIPDPEGSTAATYINAGELELTGLEFDGKFGVNDDFYIITGASFLQNTKTNGNEEIENYTTVPNTMIKLGLTYNFEFGMRCGFYNSFYSAAEDIIVRNPDRLDVNPSAEAYNMATLNIRFDLNKTLNLSNLKQKMALDFYFYNLFDQDVNMPEFSRGRINTLPTKQGLSFYAKFNFMF